MARKHFCGTAYHGLPMSGLMKPKHKKLCESGLGTFYLTFISMTFLSGNCMHENTFCVRIKEKRFEKPNDRPHASDESF